MRKRFTWFIGLLSVSVPARAAEPAAVRSFSIDDPPQGTFVDDWLEIYLGDEKAGYGNSTFTREGDEIISRMALTFRLARAGTEIKVGVTETGREALDGTPGSFESVTDMSSLVSTLSGTIHDGKVIVSRCIGSGATTIPAPPETFDYPRGALMSWGLYRRQHQLKPVEGLVEEVRAYAPSLRLDDAVTVRFKVGKRGLIEYRGNWVGATRVDQTFVGPAGEMTIVSWVDERFEPLIIEYPIPGIGSLKLVTTDKASATKEFAAPEFFVPTIIRVERPIDRKAARKIVYRLGVTGKGDDLPALPTTGLQKPCKHEGRTMELTVERQDHAAIRAACEAADAGNIDPDVKPYLAPSLQINSDDPAVIEMAKEAGGNEANKYVLADKLRRYVTDEIKEKGLDVGFASASEVCRQRRGDCSEHAVLLAALGRARGIPARVVVGLVYVPTFSGADDVFGFHMWTQFYLAGQWVDFDAAQRESDCNPTHIALAVMTNTDTSMADAAFRMVPVMGRLKIDVLSIE